MRKFIRFTLQLIFLGSLFSCEQVPIDMDDLISKKVISDPSVEWTQIGPGMSGYSEEFWCHPINSSAMYMSPDMYNSYGTWDGGDSWQTIKDYDGTGIDMRRVESIQFSHQKPNFGLAIDVRGYLFNTTDSGRNWEKVDFDLGGRHSELAVDPTNDQIWYIGAGDFWNVKFNHRSQASLNDPSKGYFYRYSEYGHIFKSTDGGSSWRKITKGLPDKLDVGKIIVDPTNPNTVFAATNYGFYRSTDQGESWIRSGESLPNNMPRDMDHYYNPETKEFILYLLDQTSFTPDGNTIKSNGGIFKSVDHGLTWTNITGNLEINLTQITDNFTRNKYYQAIAFWFDIDSGEARNKFPDLPEEVLPVYNRLRVNPINKDEIFVSHNVKHDKSFGPGDVWKTHNGGENWNPTARTGMYWSQNENANYWSSRKSPMGVNTKFAHLQNDMDRGVETWGNRFLEMNPDGDVYICLDQQTLKSTDGGESWFQIDDKETEPGSNHWIGSGNSNLPGRFMLLETGIKNRYLFCSGEHGLWQSAPLGDYPDRKAVALKQIEGQVNANGAHSIASVAVHPKDPNIIYTLQFRQSHRGKFRRSIDGGKTWHNLSEPLPYGGNLSSDNIFQYSLTVDYENPDNIYFCVMSNPITEVSGHLLPDDFNMLGVIKSTDGGLNWSTANEGLPEGFSVHRLKMHPDNPAILYAALNEGPSGSEGGLYKSENRGESWTKMSIPSEIVSVNNVFIDRNNKYLYISCGRERGSIEEGGVWVSHNSGENWEKIFYLSYIWQTETSPLNPNIITVNAAMPHDKFGGSLYNPGAYLSKDGGETWIKINKNLGQPNTITDLKPDPYIEGVYWCALKGSGWAIGYERGAGVNWWDEVCKLAGASGKSKQ